MARKSGPGNRASSEIERKVSIKVRSSKHEYRNPKQIRLIEIQILNLVFVSSFGFRILTLLLGSAHPGNFRQTQDCAKDPFAFRRFDFVDRNCVRDIEPSGLGAS